MVKSEMIKTKTSLKQVPWLQLSLSGFITMISLSACQTIQPYNGKTGYQREPSNSDQVIISYTLDRKATDEIVNQKLQKACAKELGLAPNTLVKINILDQKEFITSNPQASFSNNVNNSTVPVGSSNHTSFGLSTTPRLSNSSNTAGIDMLNASPDTLKQVTAACLR